MGLWYPRLIFLIFPILPIYPNRPKTIKTNKTIRKFVRNHHNRPKVLIVLIFPILLILPLSLFTSHFSPFTFHLLPSPILSVE